MPRNRKLLGCYTARKINALRERGKRMSAARWNADRARRDAEEPERLRAIEETAIQNLPHKTGDPLGCLQWTDYRTGRVRRWIVRIGDRVDRVTIETPGNPPSKSHGWTWLTQKIRAHLCRPAP